MSILTAERLVSLAYRYPHLQNTWYLIATACLTVINQPQEIPKLYHFALRQQLLEDPNSSTPDSPSLLTNHYLIQLAQDSISSAKKYQDLSAVGVNLPDILIPHGYYQELPLRFKFSKNEDIHQMQDHLTSRFREVILKSVALSGLPKAINALMVLKTVTPSNLKPGIYPERPCIVRPGYMPSASIISEDVFGTKFDKDDDDDGDFLQDTVNGPISESSINKQQIAQDLIRGSRFWTSVYTKISLRVKNQMLTAYPDLWHYAYEHVYAPLLSYTQIISAKETSMCVVACLIPQDVNPQLKGHLKGALNNGATKEELNDIRSMVFNICDWSGGTKWKGGKESVAKL
ncbi:hypothetical protein KGF56_003086 [Candida oxycetoniae]|uniref:Carboxymuconolactone decarboxylase-like domain-containing protein n=1 Tax=Candida oxycetoniae TaxID=497107 RepID=A0AAI9WXR4_9ASCO|nr:uncharacterized protein KGF56_003086 [Candida oxycetoniae]KAI3404050.1 hypothetical protein KGF56_003086 [Candida oxycetoniae]